MDINPAYSCLLSKLWIHVVGAVTSTLHQRMKFLIDDKLVNVCGEEDLLVSKLSSFRYVETNEGIVEILLHCLEFEEVSSVIANHDQSSATVLSLVRNSKQTLEKCLLPGWGRVVDMAEKRDRFGIGYHPAACKASPKKSSSTRSNSTTPVFKTIILWQSLENLVASNQRRPVSYANVLQGSSFPTRWLQ